MKLESLCTNNESYFFRELNALEWVCDRVAERPKTSEPPRLWSAGASTGEEAYTLAILLESRACKSYKIIGSDIDVEAVRASLAGEYSPNKMRNVPPLVKKNYFVDLGNKHRLRTELFKNLSFYRCNLLRTQFGKSMGPFDAIVCRNVLIYFNRDAQEKLIDSFYEALAPDGILLLGACESLISVNHSFVHKFEQDISYYHKKGAKE